MGTIAARKFGKVVDNAENVLAMEVLSGCQAIDLLTPLKPSSSVLDVFNLVRTKVPFAKEDRVFAQDVNVIRSMIRDGSISKTLAQKGELEW